MKVKFLYILIIFSTFIISRAYCEDSRKEDGTYLNLSATETMQVEPDLLIASLRYESESISANEVQTKINQTMQKALELSQNNEKLNVSTKQYSVYKYNLPMTQGVNEKEVWKGSQSIVIKGKSAADILVLSGKLQEMGLLMSDLHYEISSEKIEEVRNSMLENAIQKLLSQAKKTANIIGAKTVNLKNINIDGDNRSKPYHELLRGVVANNMSEASAYPVSSPGKSDITLTISASILLQY